MFLCVDRLAIIILVINVKTQEKTNCNYFMYEKENRHQPVCKTERDKLSTTKK